MPHIKKPVKNPYVKIGRRPKDLTEAAVFAMARSRFTQQEAAAALDIDRTTLTRHLQLNPKLREAWDRGKQMYFVSLKRLQWKHAQMKNSAGVNMTIHLSKHDLGEHDKALFEHSGPGGSALVFPTIEVRFVRAVDGRQVEPAPAMKTISPPVPVV
jgi:hypothetical protein